MGAAQVSGSFTLSAESMGRSADGEPLAKFIITLGGASMLKQQAKQQVSDSPGSPRPFGTLSSRDLFP